MQINVSPFSHTLVELLFQVTYITVYAFRLFSCKLCAVIIKAPSTISAKIAIHRITSKYNSWMSKVQASVHVNIAR